MHTGIQLGLLQLHSMTCHKPVGSVLALCVCEYFGTQGILQDLGHFSQFKTHDFSQILFNRHRDLCVFNLKPDYLGVRQQGWISSTMVWDAKNGALWLVPSVIALDILTVWLAESGVQHVSVQWAQLLGTKIALLWPLYLTAYLNMQKLPWKCTACHVLLLNDVARGRSDIKAILSS